MEYVISALIGYLIGSFPTAYLLLKSSKNIDITKAGTGNVGAFNSYEVTGSKLTGWFVFLLDALKGALSVFIPMLLYLGEFILPTTALIFAVLSHCFNPWLKFKGGRGLATAAGGAFIIFPYLLLVWAVLWVIFYLMKKDIHLANITAIIMSLIILYSTGNIAVKYAYPKPVQEFDLYLISTAILGIIFIKHLKPLKELIQKAKLKKASNHD